MIPLIAMIAAFYGPEPAGRVAETADMASFAGIVLLSEGGKVTLEKGFGTKVPQRMVRARTPSDFLPGDSWRWASVTKQITATIAMQDVAAGRLELDAPITRYLPAFKGATGKRITVGMLLGHTSGLPDSNAGDGAAFRPGARVLPDAVCAGAYREFADLSKPAEQFKPLTPSALDGLYEKLGEAPEASTDLLFV